MEIVPFSIGLDNDGSVASLRQKTYSIFYEWSSIHEKAISIPEINGVKAKIVRIVPILDNFSYTDNTNSAEDSLKDSNGGGAVGGQLLLTGPSEIKLSDDSTYIHLKNISQNACHANLEFYS